MPTNNFIVISDLHLADGHAILEGFRSPQQAALEGLLHAALPGGPLGDSSAATLIVNGDCFDFLAVPPYLDDGRITPQIALEKLKKIANAHQPFFTTLRDFLDLGGKVVFLPGNHDIELCFKEIRSQITLLIEGRKRNSRSLQFGLKQSFQPCPDVYIEHGNQYDFWNYVSDIWDEQGKTLTSRSPRHITLPVGTQYLHCAALPVTTRYPYFDHFDPLLGTMHQIALLSLINPEMLVETARRTVKMMSYPHQALQNLVPGDEYQPAQLFRQAMPDFLAFQQDMLARVPTWQVIEEQLYTPDERAQDQSNSIAEFVRLYGALEQSTEEALNAIFQPPPLPVDDGTTRGMHGILHKRPDLRIAIAGHTHIKRFDRFGRGQQVYLNTASWMLRYAPPVPGELTSQVVAWLRQPEGESFPLRDKTGYIFAWVSAETGQPSTAHLCVWEGGKDGHYRILDE